MKTKSVTDSYDRATLITYWLIVAAAIVVLLSACFSCFWLMWIITQVVTR